MNPRSRSRLTTKLWTSWKVKRKNSSCLASKWQGNQSNPSNQNRIWKRLKVKLRSKFKWWMVKKKRVPCYVGHQWRHSRLCKRRKHGSIHQRNRLVNCLCLKYPLGRLPRLREKRQEKRDRSITILRRWNVTGRAEAVQEAVKQGSNNTMMCLQGKRKTLDYSIRQKEASLYFQRSNAGMNRGSRRSRASSKRELRSWI